MESDTAKNFWSKFENFIVLFQTKGDMIYYTEQIMDAQATNNATGWGPDEEWNSSLMKHAITGIKEVADKVLDIDIDHSEPQLLHCKPQSHGYTLYTTVHTV